MKSFILILIMQSSVTFAAETYTTRKCEGVWAGAGVRQVSGTISTSPQENVALPISFVDEGGNMFEGTMARTGGRYNFVVGDSTAKWLRFAGTIVLKFNGGEIEGFVLNSDIFNGVFRCK